MFTEVVDKDSLAVVVGTSAVDIAAEDSLAVEVYSELLIHINC